MSGRRSPAGKPPVRCWINAASDRLLASVHTDNSRRCWSGFSHVGRLSSSPTGLPKTPQYKAPQAPRKRIQRLIDAHRLTSNRQCKLHCNCPSCRHRLRVRSRPARHCIRHASPTFSLLLLLPKPDNRIINNRAAARRVEHGCRIFCAVFPALFCGCISVMLRARQDCVANYYLLPILQDMASFSTGLPELSCAGYLPFSTFMAPFQSKPES